MSSEINTKEIKTMNINTINLFFILNLKNIYKVIPQSNL